jgi:nitrogen fixation protein FixH
MSGRKPFRLTGWHVLAITVGFFGLVIGVNAVFIVSAVKTFPGEVSKTPYEDGLAYDRTIDARERQAALGWTAEVEADRGPGVVLARFTDARGAPIEGLSLTGELQRPATTQGAHALAFRSVGHGVYEARAAAPGGGWDLTLTARDGKGRAFEAERRIVWP